MCDNVPSGGQPAPAGVPGRGPGKAVAEVAASCAFSAVAVAVVAAGCLGCCGLGPDTAFWAAPLAVVAFVLALLAVAGGAHKGASAAALVLSVAAFAGSVTAGFVMDVAGLARVLGSPEGMLLYPVLLAPFFMLL